MSDHDRAATNFISSPSPNLKNAADKIPLFRNYPLLEKKLPHISLATLPSPVEQLTKVGEEIGSGTLYIKRDDLNGKVYGSNKVRKLEFLLADALDKKAGQAVTIGFAGSNHALATAIYAKKLGLEATSFLMGQANAHYVRRNLLAGHFFGAKLRHYRNLEFMLLALAAEYVKYKLKRKAFPYFVPPGGTSPLGIVSYANAAFELKEQITAGEMPAPDYIYVPMGSMGTSAGLILGLKAAGLKTKVIAVRVIEKRMANKRKLLRLIKKTNMFLRKLDPSFPLVSLYKDDFEVRNEYLGAGYARFTDKGVKAAALMKSKAGIIMNGAYSAKAFAALTDDARSGFLEGKTALYWNTYNSRDLSAIAAKVDYRDLPKEFHRYFEEEVQRLDACQCR